MQAIGDFLLKRKNPLHEGNLTQPEEYLRCGCPNSRGTSSVLLPSYSQTRVRTAAPILPNNRNLGKPLDDLKALCTHR